MNMKNIMKFVGVCFLLYILYVFILLALSFGHARETIVEIPKELKQLEKEIQKETNDSENNFRPILEHEMENCEVSLYIYIYI
jgi:hypothetical protein